MLPSQKIGARPEATGGRAGATGGALPGAVPAGPDDGQLLAALGARGQHAPAALDALYERHAPGVYGYLLAQLGPGERAESVLVETFARLWTRPASAPRDGADLARWLLLNAHQLAGLAAPPRPAANAPAAPVAASAPQVARLEDVLITPELARRPSRPPDLRAENDAFFRITRQLANHASPEAVFQTLVDAATELCGAGTAGLSLLEEPPEGDAGGGGGEACFRWTHMAGALAAAVGGTTPRAFSPCGVTLDRGAPQLFSQPARYFDYLAAAPAPIVEGLVIPLAAAPDPDAPPLGTIWIVSHDPGARPFDWEDARIMTSLANFTAIALQIASGTRRTPLQESQSPNAREAREARVGEALAAERAAILDQLSDGVIVADADGRIVLVNEAARRLHGVRELGVSVADYAVAYRLFTMEGEPYPADRLPLARAVLHGETVEHARWRIRRPDGTDIVAEGSATPVLLADGARYGSVLVLRDVTDQVALERQKDEFLGSVSHDLKNPLATIRGTAQLLRRQLARGAPPSADTVGGALAAVESAAVQMADQLDTVLDVARSGMGRPLDLLPRPTDLVGLARQLVDETQRATETHRVLLDTALPQLVGTWDGARLRRALRNLLSNALAYSPDGGDVTVTIRTEASGAGQQDGQDEAILSVQDSGLGIPASDLPFVFERFRRGANVAGRIGGTGIGLADDREVVGQHGGTVEVESAEGTGSRFTVRLPLSPPVRSPAIRRP